MIANYDCPDDSILLGEMKGEITVMTKPRIYTMSFARVYPEYIAKADKKGRTKTEVDEIIRWLTGYSQEAFEAQL